MMRFARTSGRVITVSGDLETVGRGIWILNAIAALRVLVAGW